MPAKASSVATHDSLLDPSLSTDGPIPEERKRYTTQLQRRAQAHITAELGGSTVAPDTDRQVTSIVQHTQRTTGARRVSLYRPVTRGKRWHVATMLADGGFYYGLTSQDSMGWSQVAVDTKRSVVLAGNDAPPPGTPRLPELGVRSYIGVPVLADGQSVAVIEAVDIEQDGSLDRLADELEKTIEALADSLVDQSKQQEQTSRRTDSSEPELTADSIVDLVLRPPLDVDDTFEVTPGEWAVLNFINGESQLRAVADQASLPLSQVVSCSISLIERGLVRIGKENRRRL
jgi:hypothetical protein